MWECCITCICETWDCHQVNIVNNSYVFSSRETEMGYLSIQLSKINHSRTTFCLCRFFAQQLTLSVVYNIFFCKYFSACCPNLPTFEWFAVISELRLTLPLTNLTFSLKWWSFCFLQSNCYLKTQHAWNTWLDTSFSQVHFCSQDLHLI